MPARADDAVRGAERFLDVRGIRIRVLQAGEGPPLLYLHGSEDKGDLLPVLGLLSRRFAVYRPDHPAFGQSDEDGRIDSVHDLAYFYLDLLDELELDTVTIVGASLGGWLAADIATIEPRRVERLVLVGAAGLRVDGVDVPDLFALDPVAVAEHTFHRGDLRERAAAEARQLDERPEALLAYLRNRIATAHLAWNPYLHDPKLPDRLHRVRLPALVVWGREDRILPVAHAHRWHELLPDARLEIVEDAGHLPHVEAEDSFLELAEPFLSE